MSLPKKRKRLDENPTFDKGKRDPNHVSSRDINPGKTNERVLKDSPRSKQMLKAFEIVEHIEHVHETPDHNEPKPAGTTFGSSKETQVSSTPDGLRVRVSFGPDSSKKIEPDTETGSAAMPVIEVKLKIPSFLWRVPILKDMTRNLIKRFSKE